MEVLKRFKSQEQMDSLSIYGFTEILVFLLDQLSQSVARYDIVLAAVDGVVMVVNTANSHHLHIDQ